LVLGLGAVIGPLKRLERMPAARDPAAGPEAGVGLLEGLGATHPIALVLGVILALDGEAQTPPALRVGEVEAQQHDVRPADGIDGEAALLPHCGFLPQATVSGPAEPRAGRARDAQSRHDRSPPRARARRGANLDRRGTRSGRYGLTGWKGGLAMTPTWKPGCSGATHGPSRSW